MVGELVVGVRRRECGQSRGDQDGREGVEVDHCGKN